MHCLNTTCPHSHRHNDFTAAFVLGHTHLRFYVVGIQKIKKSQRAQVTTRTTSIIRLKKDKNP